MLKTRIIPVLLWDHVAVCKPVRFRRPYRRVGSMMQNIEVLNDRNVDELMILDISGKDEPAYDKIKEFTAKTFMPVTVGGNIKTVDHIEKLLKSGADKVLLRSHVTVTIVREAVKKFGAQCIVYHFTRPSGNTHGNIVAAKVIEGWGVGEILLTCTDRDGTFEGYDLETIEAVSKSVKIPVIANGGCASIDDMEQAIRCGAHAVAASSMFLYTDITPMECAIGLSQRNIPTRIVVYGG